MKKKIVSTPKLKDKEIQREGKSRFRLYLNFAVFLFTILLYSGTFNHEFVLDDTGVISDNSITREGVKALPKIFNTGYRSTLTTTDNELYRPFSKAFFAVEWQLAPDNPSVFHVVNVILYALSCCFIFNVLFLYLRNLQVSFFSSLIFAAHPIHSEVVANIKSADEIFALLFILLSLLLIYYYLKRKSFTFLFFSVFFYFLALLSKESAVVYLGIIPIVIYYFTDTKHSKNIYVTAIHLLPVIIYLLIRNKVCGSVSVIDPSNTNYLYDIKDFLSQKATAIMLMGNYLLLMIFPYTLMSDGSFMHFPVVTVTDWRFVISFVVFMALGIYAILEFKKKSKISFSILFIFISSALASNVFILIGTNYGERLMYLPSLGFCLAVSYLIVKYTSVEKGEPGKFPSDLFLNNKRAFAIVSVIVLIFSFRTYSRAADWHDAMTLHKKDVVSAPRSARAHYYLGNEYAVLLPETEDSLTAIEYVKAGIEELRTAVSIKPDYDEAYYSLGQIYTYTGMQDSASANYLRATEANPSNARFQNNYGDIEFRKNNYEEAMRRFKLAVKLDSLYIHALTNLGVSYVKAGEFSLTKAKEAQDANNQPELESNYGMAMQYYDSSIIWLNKAIKIDKDFYLPYYFLSIVYKNKGDQQSSDYYYILSEEAKQRDALNKSR